MILVLELVLTFGGLYMLITGKPLGKKAVKDSRYRWLGAFCMTVLPVMFVIAMGVGLLFMLNGPERTEEELEAAIKWPMVGVEIGVAVTYGIIALLWYNKITRTAGQPRAARVATPMPEKRFGV